MQVEDFASDRLTHRAGDLFQPPALTNFLGSCQAGRCVLAIRHLTFPPLSCGEALLGALVLDTTCLAASGVGVTYRWRPDRIERSARVGGWKLASRTVMGVRAQEVAVRLRVTNGASRRRSAQLRIRTGDGIVRSDDGWNSPYSPIERPRISVTPWQGSPPPASLVRNRRDPLPDGAGILCRSRTSRAFLLQGTSPTPDAIDGPWLDFALDLGPGETATISFFVAAGTERAALARAFDAWRDDPDAVLAAAAADWDAELEAVVTAGNDRYSGHLAPPPTADPDTLRIWRAAVLGVVYCKRDHPASAYGRTYVTMMPCYWATTSFLNDWAASAALLAALDPDCLRTHVELWLTRDVHACFGTDYVSAADAGNWYACNDYSLVRLATAYLDATGDRGWVGKRVAGRTIRDHLKRLALHYAELDRGQGLADWGDRNSLLEAVGSYQHEVASLNAAAVWTLRAVARFLGDAEAADFRARARALARRVQDLYVEGGGYWCCRQPGGDLLPCRHAWDFAWVLALMHEDLEARQVDEMVAFFERELATPAWMHALSPLDADIDFSLRPDHAWNGSYPGWVAAAAIGLARIGRFDVLDRWLPGLAATANQGPYAQAHFVETYARPEAGGARKAPAQWPYLTDWAILAGGAFWELVTGHLQGRR